jgi:competence ComEA-like helix-hairpin-helix protein
MINSPLIQTHTRHSVSARDILSIKPRVSVVATILMLVLGISVLTGSPYVHAQEAKSAAVPAAVSAEKPAVKPSAKPAATHVNINTADAQTLAANLKGVGEARAQEIVRYREAYGPFASADELTEVKGIGKSTLDMNRDVITLE